MTQIKTPMDLAIIGGGIAGAGVARDAAMRGLRVAVFEKNTVGSGTSSKSSKLIHGGIRYLETAWDALKNGRLREAWKNFRFVFSSLKESRILETLAPDLIRPIPILIPIYRSSPRKRPAVWAGTLIYFLMARLSGKAKAPRFFWTRKAVLRKLPALRAEGLLGGVLIWDRLVDDKRLVEETMASAKRYGALVFEQSPVMRYAWKAAAGQYEITTDKQTFFAKKLVNATGPWADITRRRAGAENSEDFMLPVAGAHLVFPRFLPVSALLQAEDGRLFFVINHAEVSRVGTTERLCLDPDKALVTQEETDYLLRSLSFYFPTAHLGRNDLVTSEAGVRPLVAPVGATRRVAPTTDLSREHQIRKGTTGVYHLLGVKLTDHRRAAAEIVDKLIPEFLKSNPRLKKKTLTHKIPLH